MECKRLTFEMYMSEPASRRFKQLEDNKKIQAVFDDLSSGPFVEKMIDATKDKRPAMEAVIENVERKHLQGEAFDLEHVYRHRQILGSMIRYIMGHYSYKPGRAKPLKKGRFVKTAIVYYRA